MCNPQPSQGSAVEGLPLLPWEGPCLRGTSHSSSEQLTRQTVGHRLGKTSGSHHLYYKKAITNSASEGAHRRGTMLTLILPHFVLVQKHLPLHSPLNLNLTFCSLALTLVPKLDSSTAHSVPLTSHQANLHNKAVSPSTTQPSPVCAQESRIWESTAGCFSREVK